MGAAFSIVWRRALQAISLLAESHVLWIARLLRLADAFGLLRRARCTDCLQGEQQLRLSDDGSCVWIVADAQPQPAEVVLGVCGVVPQADDELRTLRHCEQLRGRKDCGVLPVNDLPLPHGPAGFVIAVEGRCGGVSGLLERRTRRGKHQRQYGRFTVGTRRRKLQLGGERRQDEVAAIRAGEAAVLMRFVLEGFEAQGPPRSRRSV